MLERSLRAGVLVPLLTTFGLAIVIENGLFEYFGADTRSLAPYIGDFAFDSWAITSNIYVGQLAVLIFAVAVVLLGGLKLFPDTHVAWPRDPRDRGRCRHRRTGRHQCQSRLRHRSSNRGGLCGTGRRISRHARGV